MCYLQAVIEVTQKSIQVNSQSMCASFCKKMPDSVAENDFHKENLPRCPLDRQLEKVSDQNEAI